MNGVTRSALTATARSIRPVAQTQQKRTIIDYLTNYPDKVMATKKVQMAGGTKLGEVNPTWLKQPGDAVPLAIGALLIGYGSFSCAVGHYRLATGKGKIE